MVTGLNGLGSNVERKLQLDETIKYSQGQAVIEDNAKKILFGSNDSLKTEDIRKMLFELHCALESALSEKRRDAHGALAGLKYLADSLPDGDPIQKKIYDLQEVYGEPNGK